nr:MAG TPA: hypothetical protein [Bacteriophage sp.]
MYKANGPLRLAFGARLIFFWQKPLNNPLVFLDIKSNISMRITIN